MLNVSTRFGWVLCGLDFFDVCFKWVDGCFYNSEKLVKMFFMDLVDSSDWERHIYYIGDGGRLVVSQNDAIVGYDLFSNAEGQL